MPRGIAVVTKFYEVIAPLPFLETIDEAIQPNP
jgi:hypothetical protein